MTGLAADIRHAIAVYRGTPLSSVIAILALAVAMAYASSFMAMWSDLALKPPLGFQADRLITIGQSGGYSVADNSSPLTLPVVEGINETLGSLQYMTGIATLSQWAHGNDAPVTVQAEAVTRHYSALGPRLSLGRLFEEQDHVADAEPVVILSQRFWRDELGADASVIGQTLRITQAGFMFSPASGGATQAPEAPGQDYRVIGVMSSELHGTFDDATDVWFPYEQVIPFLYGDVDDRPQFSLGTTGSVTTSGTDTVPTRMRGLAVARPGASLEAIGNELNSRFSIEGQALALGLDLTGEEMRFDVTDGVVRDIAAQREAERQVQLFLAGTLLLVVVAACNVSLFLLARAARRQKELGIRMAVGASIRRIARQLASEAGVLMLVATVLGLFISLWLSALLLELPFLQEAAWRDVSPFDWRVLGSLSLLILILTLLVSLAPIIGLRRAGIRASSGTVTARAGWGQRMAGTIQLTLTGVVAAVAVAFTWHLVYYASADRGFDPSDVLIVELEPMPFITGQIADAMSIVLERERQRDVIVGLPGVDDASFTSYAPGGAGTMYFTVVEREEGQFAEVATIYVDDHYLDVLGIPLLFGQDIDSTDRTQLVVNETYALVTYGRSNIVGLVSKTNRTFRGVARDVSYGHPAETIVPTGYTPYPRTSYPLALIKTGHSPVAMRQLLQDKIDTGELELALGDINRLEVVANRDLREDRARTILTVSSAALVVFLAAIGFYGMQRFLVTAGQREYAIRAAIGAGPRSLGWLVLSRSMLLGLPGLVFGSLLAFIFVGWLRDGFLTAAVSPLSVSGLAVVMILILVVAASLGPAAQARQTAPAALLRDD